MTAVPFNTAELSRLCGKTILLTGCSSGIGRATATTAYKHGANLILADWNEKELIGLVEELEGRGRHEGRLAFRKTNVADWNDMAEVFEHGFKTFGAIDVVISNAGVNWGETLLEHNVEPVTNKLKQPSLEGLQINLIGHIYAVNCATYYFAKRQNGQCQIIITSSAAAFLDSPPLYLYATAKAGLAGMMRSLRHDLPKQGVTINVVAPWMTMTPMAPDLLKKVWESMPCNSPEGVGHALLFPILRPEVNGKSFFVAGDDIIEIEDTLEASRPSWMGKKLSGSIDEGQRRVIGARPFG
ncbi:hypothetical protein EDB81DRAFT_756408 [Dactylonectria macrodidyma]|uniref:Ketoreductase domain-containing protein n=1 Tax=Dactylonectria macrodidyma TaxID=307937 RepID=A0A9P9FFM8_9HYPO|nr:hypothetical protein EDB81DRAFT_756408 [Dactylonectria macrodidyma]